MRSVLTAAYAVSGSNRPGSIMNTFQYDPICAGVTSFQCRPPSAVVATTADGGLHWKDVTPAQIGSYWKVFMIEPGRFDPLTAYAAVNTLRIDDQNPHLFRTHDGGKTWQEIVNGIPP